MKVTPDELRAKGIYLPEGVEVPHNEDYADFISRQPCVLRDEVNGEDIKECQPQGRSIFHHAPHKGRKVPKDKDVFYGAGVPVCPYHHDFLHGKILGFFPKTNLCHGELKARIEEKAKDYYPRQCWHDPIFLNAVKKRRKG